MQIPILSANEVWRPVVGYEGLYSVSNLGRIRGEARTVPHLIHGKRLREKLLKPRINKATGYPAVNLTCENKRKTFTVHRLVADAFLGPRPLGKVVAHCDGNKLNSAAENLRYDTYSANADDSRKHGTMAIGKRLPQSKLTVDQVRLIRQDARKYCEISAEYGIAISTVSRVKNGIDWQHVR